MTAGISTVRFSRKLAGLAIAATSLGSIRISAFLGRAGARELLFFARPTIPIDDPELPFGLEQHRDGAIHVNGGAHYY